MFKGQISTEMIIILAILLAVIALVATNLQKLAKQNVASATREGMNISNTIGEIAGSQGLATGSSCTQDYECQSGTCKDLQCN